MSVWWLEEESQSWSNQGAAHSHPTPVPVRVYTHFTNIPVSEEEAEHYRANKKHHEKVREPMEERKKFHI